MIKSIFSAKSLFKGSNFQNRMFSPNKLAIKTERNYMNKSFSKVMLQNITYPNIKKEMIKSFIKIEKAAKDIFNTKGILTISTHKDTHMVDSFIGLLVHATDYDVTSRIDYNKLNRVLENHPMKDILRPLFHKIDTFKDGRGRKINKETMNISRRYLEINLKNYFSSLIEENRIPVII